MRVMGNGGSHGSPFDLKSLHKTITDLACGMMAFKNSRLEDIPAAIRFQKTVFCQQCNFFPGCADLRGMHFDHAHPCLRLFTRNTERFRRDLLLDMHGMGSHSGIEITLTALQHDTVFSGHLAIDDHTEDINFLQIMEKY